MTRAKKKREKNGSTNAETKVSAIGYADDKMVQYSFKLNHLS